MQRAYFLLTSNTAIRIDCYLPGQASVVVHSLKWPGTEPALQNVCITAAAESV